MQETTMNGPDRSGLERGDIIPSHHLITKLANWAVVGVSPTARGPNDCPEPILAAGK